MYSCVCLLYCKLLLANNAYHALHVVAVGLQAMKAFLACSYHIQAQGLPAHPMVIMSSLWLLACIMQGISMPCHASHVMSCHVMPCHVMDVMPWPIDMTHEPPGLYPHHGMHTDGLRRRFCQARPAHHAIAMPWPEMNLYNKCQCSTKYLAHGGM